MKIGPNMPATDPTLKPRPRTIVGYSSETNNGSTTYEEEIPILPIQYKSNTRL